MSVNTLMDPMWNVYDKLLVNLPTRFRLGTSRVQASFGLSWILHCLVPYPSVISLWTWPLYNWLELLRAEGLVSSSKYLKCWEESFSNPRNNCKFELSIWGPVWRGLHIAKVWWTLAMSPTEAFFAHTPNLSNVSVKIVAQNSMNFENGEPDILFKCMRRSNSNP